MKGDYEGAKAFALSMKEIYGEDFYLEIQDHGIPEQKQILPLIVRISRETGIPLVATNDVHYLRKEDWEMQDVLMCIQMKKTLDDPDRMRMQTHEFYMKSGDEMAALFRPSRSHLQHARHREQSLRYGYALQLKTRRQPRLR